jgi:hypothetical protein
MVVRLRLKTSCVWIMLIDVCNLRRLHINLFREKDELQQQKQADLDRAIDFSSAVLWSIVIYERLALYVATRNPGWKMAACAVDWFGVTC